MPNNIYTKPLEQDFLFITSKYKCAANFVSLWRFSACVWALTDYLGETISTHKYFILLTICFSCHFHFFSFSLFTYWWFLSVLELLRKPEICVHQNNVYSSLRVQQLLFLIVSWLRVCTWWWNYWGISIAQGNIAAIAMLHCTLFTLFIAPSLTMVAFSVSTGIRRVHSLTIDNRETLCSSRSTTLSCICVLRALWTRHVCVSRDRSPFRPTVTTHVPVHSWVQRCFTPCRVRCGRTAQSFCLSFHSLWGFYWQCYSLCTSVFSKR